MAAGVTGVRVAVGDGFVGRGDLHFQLDAALVFPVPLFDGRLGVSCQRKQRSWREREIMESDLPLSSTISLWSRTNKNRDVSTGPLARPFARLLALLTRGKVNF